VADTWRDNWELAFPSEYLGAQHLHDRDQVLTISKVDRPELDMLDPGTNQRVRKRKLVLHFAELARGGPDDPKMMILNKTNARTIAALYGKAVDAWVGKRITVYPTETQVGREMKACVRIRPKSTAELRREVVKGPDSPPPDSATTPPDDLVAEVKGIVEGMAHALEQPDLMPALRERIMALPKDLPDRPLLEKSYKRLRAQLAAPQREQEP